MLSTRSSSLLGALCLLSTACIITIDEDETSDTSDDGTPPTTGLPSDSTAPQTSGPMTTSLDDTGTTGLDDTGTDDTTGGPMGDCTENLLGDPGFEAGTPSPAWDEASTEFGTPICDAACTKEPGAGPYAGDWWVWLGGIADTVEVGSVGQVVTIDPETAYLSFWLQIRSAAGTGDDMFTVTVDGDTVFMVTDGDMGEYIEYTQVTVDITAWADGGAHEVVFTGDLAGTGLTSFFVDETSLVSCVEPSGTSSSSGSDSGSDTGTTDTGSGTTDTGTSSGSGSGSSGSTG